jgi:cobalt/nickel transport protein
MRLGIVVVLVSMLGARSPAHFNMLLPRPSSAKKGEVVTVFYYWGHPFEHQLFDAPAPESVLAITPGGHKIDLKQSLEKIAKRAADGNKVTAYQLRFAPEQRGDYLLILNTPAIWMEEDQEFLQDTVKALLHVQAQKGWDAAAGEGFEVLPLTRPYGLQPGMVFQAQVQWGGTPLAGALVEVEHYNPAPPQKLPPDEHITHTLKTDPNGCLTCTLTEPGWWCLTAQHQSGNRDHDGKAYPLRQRATLWVFVDDKQGSGARDQAPGLQGRASPTPDLRRFQRTARPSLTPDP